MSNSLSNAKLKAEQKEESIIMYNQNRVRLWAMKAEQTQNGAEPIVPSSLPGLCMAAGAAPAKGKTFQQAGPVNFNHPLILPPEISNARCGTFPRPEPSGIGATPSKQSLQGIDRPKRDLTKRYNRIPSNPL